MAKKTVKKASIKASEKKVEAIEEEIKPGRLIVYLLRFLIVATILGLSGTSFYYYQQYRKVKISPEISVQSEKKQIIDKISSFMLLPEEEPTIATVSDKEKLSEKDFFKNSENGDKILIYAESKKAILYRPSINKIIEVAPLLMNQEDIDVKEKGKEKTDKSTFSEEELNISIRNGTKKAGLAARTETKLVSVEGISVYEKSNTVRDDYKETLIIDITKKNDNLVDEIATVLGGETSTLPEDESVSDDVDVLVIVGE